MVICLADFQTWLVEHGFAANVLPPTSWIVKDAFELSKDTVSLMILQISHHYYRRAVYNLGADIIVNNAPDVSGSNFFENMRKEYHINSFVAGVVTSTSDNGDSVSLATPDGLKELTISDLQNLKTPWGREYLSIAQRTGTLWGIS